VLIGSYDFDAPGAAAGFNWGKNSEPASAGLISLR
jgi:hypothetical protein